MKIKKFQAPDMRQALTEIKSELGPDAMVVATREIRQGMRGTAIEVTAAVDSERRPSPQLSPVPVGQNSRNVERLVAPLRSELRSLRTMIRSQSSAFPTHELRAEIATLRQLVTALERHKSDPPPAQATESITDMAAGKRLTAPSQGRVVALVGPTGVGKTTTIAKLAGTEALIDRKRVALITLDSYRVGGQEQMRVFADLIGVPLYIAEDSFELTEALAKSADCDRIYIDTAGRSPRDDAAIERLEQMLRGVEDLEIHLTMTSTSDSRMLDATVRHFGRLGIDRLLFTKLDESEDLSNLVRVPARFDKRISYLTTGQRIPEDLEPANEASLIKWATDGFVVEAVA